MRKSIFTVFLIPLILISLLLASSALYATDAGTEDLSEKRVLYLSSYSPSYETFFRQVDGIESILQPYDVHLDIEFMDTKRLSTDENMAYFDQIFSYKLSQLQPYDVVIVADDNATSYLMDQRETYFPDTPIVFMGVNNLENAETYSRHPMVTGIVEEISMAETLALAKKLNPEAQNFVALADETTSGLHDLSIYYDQADLFQDMTMTHINLAEMTFDEFGTAISQLGPKDIVIRISAYRDITGKTITFAEGVDLILDHATQPVYHTYYWGIPDGFIGGKVVTHFEQGVTAGQLCLDILQGTPVSNIPLVKNSPNQYMINLPVMKEFGYDESLLPEGTVLINEDISIFSQYRSYILTAFLVLVIQALIIFNLYRNIQSRKLSQAALTEKKKELVVANDELTAYNEELIAALANIEEKDERIHRLINIDSLTGLKNRFSISDHIQKTLLTCDRDVRYAILFLDVDNFKHINDTFGHNTGDEVIQATGKLLEEFVSDRVSVGRFGGDEFLLFIEYKDIESDLEPLITDIQQAFTNILTINQRSFYLTVSIGIALYPDNALTQADLTKQADMALYEAKAHGKNTRAYFDDSMNKELTDKMDFQNAVREGFANGEFRMNYQPYIDLTTGRVSGLESLIRWKSPSLGNVSPYELIRATEEMGMIVELGEWILRESCSYAKRINELHEDDITISINVSAVQVMSHNFSDTVLDIIDSVGIRPDLVCLEVTETILLDSMDSGKELIDQLQHHGIRISMDDFGTGYSSLSYFKELPFDILKIDKSFIDNIANTDYDAYLSNVMVALAHMKSQTVIAEGVEDQKQLEILKSFGCDMIQGYFFSEPLEASEVDKYIASMNK